MARYILGLDIGGTKCAAVLAGVEDGIELLRRISFPSDTHKGFADLKDRLFAAGHEVLEGIDASELLAVGVSCGGPLDSKRGLILSPPNLPGWDGIPITDMLAAEFGVPAFLQNDANACALVEWKIGAGRGAQNMIFLTMGTGFGAGIVSEGRLVEGASGLAGEVGHIRLESDGPEAFGKTGTVEGYCSGAGIALAARESTRELLASGRTPAWMQGGASLEDITAKLIADYAERGDADALAIYERVGERVGQTLSILIDLLNPECIVIGSVFVRAERHLRPAMERVLARECLPGALADCRIVPARMGERLGDYACVLAACYALEIDIEPMGDPRPDVLAHADRLFERYPALDELRQPLLQAHKTLRAAFAHDKKLLICGNGGSAADAEHIVGELMKGFLLPRTPTDAQRDILGADTRLQRALPAIALTQHAALSSAFGNDVDATLTFAQQVFGYGRRGDVLLCLSTSGNARNVVEAARTARAIGMRVIALTGRSGGELARWSDVLLAVPATLTPDVQEYHLPVYHALCAMIEAECFGG